MDELDLEARDEMAELACEVMQASASTLKSISFEEFSGD